MLNLFPEIELYVGCFSSEVLFHYLYFSGSLFSTSSLLKEALAFDDQINIRGFLS